MKIIRNEVSVYQQKPKAKISCHGSIIKMELLFTIRSLGVDVRQIAMVT